MIWRCPSQAVHLHLIQWDVLATWNFHTSANVFPRLTTAKYFYIRPNSSTLLRWGEFLPEGKKITKGTVATHSKLPEMFLFRFIMIFFRLILFCIFSGLFSRGAHSWHLPHGRPAGSISRCVFPMAPRGMEGVGPDSPPPLPRKDIFIKKEAHHLRDPHVRQM